MLLCCIQFACAYFVDNVKFLKPSNFDVLLNDITEAELRIISEMEGAPYLNISTLKPTFPVEGIVMGTNRRYIVNLLVRRKSAAENPYRNVMFMIDTGSPYTFLSTAAIEAMVNTAANVPEMLKLEIQGGQPMICYLSPPDKHFADVNLLGMDFLEMHGTQIHTDWSRKTFYLHDSKSSTAN